MEEEVYTNRRTKIKIKKLYLIVKTTLKKSGFLYSKVMNQINLPFEIGQEYEDLEFDLEVMEEEKIQGFDSYIYLGEIYFLDVIPKYTELIFSLDILQIVIMVFEFNSLAEQIQFKQKISQNFKETEHLLKQSSDEFRVEVSYGNSKYLDKIYR